MRTLAITGAMPILIFAFGTQARASYIIVGDYLTVFTNGASVIVVAEVTGVSDEPSGLRVARARVKEAWKGSPGSEVSFRASPTWACDTSTAVPGETILLFLYPTPGEPFMSIVTYGSGRIQIKDERGKSFVLLGYNAPATLPKVELVDDYVGVELEQVKEYVLDLVRKSAQEDH
jgi:hypothetical protein